MATTPIASLSALASAVLALALALVLTACTHRSTGGPAATGTVAGRVVDAGERPVAGVAVRFHRNADAVLSDADGRFVLAFSYDAHLAPHATVVVLERPPHAPLSVEVALSDGAEIDLGNLTLD